MRLEEQRFLHEDLERLEQGISDRVLDEPRHVRERLARDHQIASFLNRIEEQSQKLLDIYKDADGVRKREVQALSTGDMFDAFYRQYDEIKDFHRRYPHEPVENLERAYRKGAADAEALAAAQVDGMFTGEEAYGRFLDLTLLHERYLNLRGVKRLTYLQYLDVFAAFAPPQCPLRRADKRTDQYFAYLGALAAYLESVLQRTRPLEDHGRLLADIAEQFGRAWDANAIPEWAPEAAAEAAATAAGPAAERGAGSAGAAQGGLWCADCAKEFTNENVYKNHLSGKKHQKAAQARAAAKSSDSANASADGAPGMDGEGGAAEAAAPAPPPPTGAHGIRRLKDRAIAEREFRIGRLAEVLKQQSNDTRVNVERKQGMTERERQMELEALFANAAEPAPAGGGGDDSDSDGEEKIYNPLKLPLAWDGKPIPYWLYKLHGLGVEFPCQICGNFVYMGRRAFDKHFNEARHIYGLKCLGITNTVLFREITGIEDALKLWEKIQRDKKREKTTSENVVQMEDAEGNVMPEKVYYDLQKQGLL